MAKINPEHCTGRLADQLEVEFLDGVPNFVL